jgi:hypothetical protein
VASRAELFFVYVPENELRTSELRLDVGIHFLNDRKIVRLLPGQSAKQKRAQYDKKNIWKPDE